ncbi:2-hydroxychromene-2-carboxylate isomerase [Trueperella bonasi]|uniref:2-hydroxychromene-2-carboxylate isomerase n=1 Tax=Trueperella bonasi TaxID=312286 RepID=A0ABT9NHM2_9ACTO|nr:DsbA family protein [Trueperella bonasi]MDP9806875.1 2-hydroxychromene-2-carboxylate isomerase [Trueperella bonasi]
MSEKVNFWFDPSCPWTWMTSRWLAEVAELRDLDVTWRAFSLYELNRGRDLPADYREHIDEIEDWGRVTMAVAHEAPDKLADFYTELGTRAHNNDEPKVDQTIVAALEAVGLDDELLERAKAGEFDDAVRESTQEALKLVGDDVGVPIIETAGTAFFGPVMSPAPKGDDAAKAWDGTLALAQTKGFFELKRSRDVGPIFD